MFIPIVTNPCGHPHCREPMCTDIDWMCPHFKPRLFGFIPIPHKLGERLTLWDEARFLKKHVRYTDEPFEDWEGDFDE